MKFLRGLLKILNKPFPEQESSFGLLKLITIISVFVTFVLYVFQPFGISTLESNKFFICLGFGSMTFIASVTFEFVVGRLLKLKSELEQWTFGKWILYNLGVILTISLANFLYARILLFGSIQWELLPDMMYGTFMIGIIPITVLGGLSIFIQEKKYQSIAAHLNQQKGTHSPGADSNEGFLFEIPFGQIKYIESLQNYVSIGYVGSEGQFRKKMERAT
ncbi:MAG: hypothetical protein RIA63_04915, partial [Cyclobacteriaceae bacterium]